MNTRQNVKSGSSIEQQLSSVNMSLEKRSAVLRDVFIAELIVDSIEWIGAKFKQACANAAVKPNLYYWE